MRNLPDVIDQIFAEIPDDFEDKETVSVQFGSIKQSSNFAPPELQTIWWCELAAVLEEHFFPADEDWKHTLLSIFEDRPKGDWKQGF